MARGWESKSVEQQQDEARSEATARPSLSPEQIVNEQKRQSLKLSRKHTLAQLERATNAQHRQMLEAALKDLDAQLAKIS